jgi:tetratricopeptide (TPR) repeat protein
MDTVASNLMEEGWKAREDLEFEKAEKLLTEAKELFEKVGDWFNVTEALNHLAYTQKLKAVRNNLEGMKYVDQARKIAVEHNIKVELVYRALMSLASSSGLFEQALEWAEKSLDYFTAPAAKADILSHIAIFQLRTGKLEKAEKTINQAESLMDQGFNLEREPHRSVWKSKMLATKALVLYNKGSLKEAKKYFGKAREVAEKQNLKLRLDEINALSGLFS